MRREIGKDEVSRVWSDSSVSGRKEVCVKPKAWHELGVCVCVCEEERRDGGAH